MSRQIPQLSRKERLILSLLSHRGEMYGLEMVRASQELKRGTIYVTLARMADKGYVESRQERDMEAPGVARRLFRATDYGSGVFKAWELAQSVLTEQGEERQRDEQKRRSAAAARSREVTAEPAAEAAVATAGGVTSRTLVHRRVNQLVDELERGEMSRLEFLRAAAGIGALAAGLSTFVTPEPAGAQAQEKARVQAAPRLPNDLVRSGFIVRVTRVDPSAGNTIEGLVLPEAAPFWQRLASGEWKHRTVSGSGVIEVDGKGNEVPAGKELTIPAGKRFTYVNSGVEPWTFTATLPFWAPPSFTYGYRDAEYRGDEIWFEIKRAPTERAVRPVYRLIPASEKMNYAVIAVGPGEKTLGVASTKGSLVVTPIAGEVSLATGQGASARSAALARGSGQSVRATEVFSVVNGGGAPALVEMRPDPPRIWTPEAMSWALDKGGKVSSGDKVWFELVIPV